MEIRNQAFAKPEIEHWAVPDDNSDSLSFYRIATWRCYRCRAIARGALHGYEIHAKLQSTFSRYWRLSFNTFGIKPICID